MDGQAELERRSELVSSRRKEGSRLLAAELRECQDLAGQRNAISPAMRWSPAGRDDDALNVSRVVSTVQQRANLVLDFVRFREARQVQHRENLLPVKRDFE